MASVFLSYDRDDLAAAGSIARALEKAGHGVWWDRHIKGGAQYSKEIEQALKSAEAVVVLWSERSVESAWVRDEAAAGRDTGRLVPVRLDEAEPPLGFRQYQAIDMSGRKGRRGSKTIQALIEAVEALGGQPSEPIARSKPAERKQSSSMPRGMLVGLFFAALAAAALFAWKPWDRGAFVPVVAVQSADPTAASQGLARDLMIKLGSLQKARADYLRLTEDKTGADLVLEASSARAGTQDEASLALFEGKDRNLLWSQQLTRPVGDVAGLREQAAITAARILACALQALNDEKARVGQEVLKLYLNGCASFEELAYGELRQMIPIMREVTERSPKFAGGWGKLIQAEILTSLSGPADPTLLEPLKRDIAEARRFHPHLAEAYLGEVELLPADAYGARLSLLDRSIENNPSHADTFAARAHYLRIVGRVGDSVSSAKRGAELNPLSPALQYDYVTALGHAGQFDTAKRELERAERRWPSSSVIADARFRFDLRYGDPRQADRAQQRGSTLWAPRLTEAFIKARVAPTTANIEAAIAEAEAISRQEKRGIGILVSVLGSFDREQQAIPLLLQGSGADLANALSETMFRPYMRELWHDRRFMKIARHLRLTDYWQESGKWPDFCFEPDVPYDCKAEAAKLSGKPS